MATNRDYPLLIYDRKKMEIENLTQENTGLRVKANLADERYKRLVADYNKLSERFDKAWRPATYYLQMQRAILDNPILQGEWSRFCSFLKMAEIDIDKDCDIDDKLK